MSAAGIRWLDLEALMAEEPPAVPWVVDPLLARGALTMLAGPAGVGKSLLALALASAVAHGAPMLAGMAVAGGPVVLLDAENGERTLHERAHLVRLPPERVRAGLAEGFDLRRPQAAEELAAALTDAAIALLVLDSLATLAPGLKENEVDQVGPVLDRLRRLAQGTGTAVLLLHHTRKDGDVYRGGTGIPAAVDVAAVYSRPRDSSERDRRVLDWSHERGGKMRLGPEPAARHLRVSAVGGHLVIDPAEPPAGGEGAEPVPTHREALRAQAVALVIERGPPRQAEVLRELGLAANDRTGRRALKDAERADELARLPDGRYGGGRHPATPACHPVAPGMAGSAPVGGACLPANGQPESEADPEWDRTMARGGGQR